jgi:hypothetical protein
MLPCTQETYGKLQNSKISPAEQLHALLKEQMYMKTDIHSQRSMMQALEPQTHAVAAQQAPTTSTVEFDCQ